MDCFNLDVVCASEEDEKRQRAANRRLKSGSGRELAIPLSVGPVRPSSLVIEDPLERFFTGNSLIRLL
jgi:hypothetical protein